MTHTIGENMRVIYPKEEVPRNCDSSVFLAGPTPRSEEVKSWRPEAIGLFEQFAYEGIVFSPEPRDGKWQGEYIDQVEWEEQALTIATCILFWIPRDLNILPGFTTNDEWGTWKASGKVVFGAPINAPKVKYQRYYAKKLHVPNAVSLQETVQLALDMIKQANFRP